MIWLAVVFTIVIVSFESRHFIKARQWRTLATELFLLGLGLTLSAMITLHAWLYIDLLLPLKTVFTPLTGWIYGLM